MRWARYLGVVLVALMAVALTTCSRGPATITISVVGTNDLHGGILARNGLGGLALFGGHVANLRAARAKDGGAVMLLDAGDMFQGTLESNLTEGAPVIAAYNTLGYSGATIGNHDFDYGPSGDQATPINPDEDPRGALKARAAEARFPFLAANILDTGTHQPVEWPNVQPSTIVDISGVKIGLVGLTTTETLKTTISMNTYGLEIAPLAPALANEAAKLRKAGATVVIGVAHAGGECRAFAPDDLSSCDADEEIFEVARALPAGAVDMIVAGHRHEMVAHEVAGVAIIESRSGGRAFGRVDLTVDRRTGRVQSHRIFPMQDICAQEDPAKNVCVNAGTPGAAARRYEGLPIAPDAAVEKVLAPAVHGAVARRDTPLNITVTAPIKRFENGHSPLGNFLVDLMVKKFGPADAAIYNTGGLRADLPVGPLTYGRLYEVFPFDNRVARVMMTGDELRRVAAANLAHDGGSVLLLGGVRAVASCVGPTLQVKLERDNGKRVQPTDQLRVVTVDFLATGGDAFFEPIEPIRLIGAVSDGPIFRDVLAFNLMRIGGNLTIPPALNGPHGLIYSGTRPVTCPAATR